MINLFTSLYWVKTDTNAFFILYLYYDEVNE